MLNIRQFTKIDWYGMAGAEAWDTSEPLWAEFDTENSYVYFIADKNGVEVNWFKENTDDTRDENRWTFFADITPLEARKFLELIGSMVEVRELNRQPTNGLLTEFLLQFGFKED